jgi:hypothetical protein
MHIHVLIDLRATHYFVANRIVRKLGGNVKMVERGFIIGTPLSEIVNVNFILKGVKINIKGCEMRVDLIPLELQDFDMDWLGINKAQMDCFAKVIILERLNGRKIIFRGERNVVPNCLISTMTANKMVRKGCEAYLAFVIDSKRRIDELTNFHIVQKFPDIFPEELSGLPLEREIYVSIDILFGTSPMVQSPYQIALVDDKVIGAIAGIVR